MLILNMLFNVAQKLMAVTDTRTQEQVFLNDCYYETASTFSVLCINVSEL